MHFLLTTVSAIMDDRAEKQKIVVHPKATTACSLIHQPTVFIALVLAFHAPRITTSFSSSTSISSSSHQSNNAKGTGKQQLFVQLIGPPWGRKRHGPRKQWWMAIHNRQPVWRRAVQQRTQVNWTTLGRRHCTSELSLSLSPLPIVFLLQHMRLRLWLFFHSRNNSIHHHHPFARTNIPMFVCPPPSHASFATLRSCCFTHNGK